MDINLIIEVILVILVVAGYFITGNYYRKRAENLSGWRKWIVSRRAFILITSGIILLGILLYYLFIRLK